MLFILADWRFGDCHPTISALTQKLWILYENHDSHVTNAVYSLLYRKRIPFAAHNKLCPMWLVGLGVLATTWSVHISRSNSCRLTSIPCPSEQEVMNYSQPKMVNLDWLYWMMMGNSLYQSNHTLWLWFYRGRSFVHFSLLPVNMTV